MKIRTVAYLMLLLGLFVPVYGIAQQPTIGFKHLTYRDGLMQNPIATLLQDKSGYIWVGSWSGLSRYDGTSFKVFHHNDSLTTEISHNRINKLYEDHAARMWVGTGGGLNLYNKNTESFIRVGLSTAKGGGNFITDIIEDANNLLWVSTYKGLKFYNPTAKTLKSPEIWNKQGESELYAGIVFSLFQDARKMIWAGVKQGVKRFDPVSKQVLNLPGVLEKDESFSSAKIIVIRQDKAGDIWFGTENSGIFRYNERDNTCLQYLNNPGDAGSLPSNWINDLRFKDGKVWVATKSGLAILNPANGVFNNYNHDSANPRSISDNSVWSLMNDRSGNVWIGTYSGGLNIYYPGNSNFSNIGESVGNNIGLNEPLAQAIVEDEDHALWIGSSGGGINYINREKRIAKYYTVTDRKTNRLSNDIKALVKDPQGDFWVGTLDGLCKFNRNTGAVKYLDLKTINNKTAGKLINALLPDDKGLWVGTNGAGLKFVNYNGNEELNFINTPGGKHGLCDNYVNCIVKDNGSLWIGTQNGLSKFNTGNHQFVVYTRKSSGLANNNVLSLFLDSRHMLWIGTDGGGLNLLDAASGKIYPIKQADGLTDNFIASITEDNSGSLWVSTNNGISKLTIKQVAFPLKSSDYTITNYNTGNGLHSNQFLVNSCLKMKSGEILFGGMNGLTSFFPERIIRNSYKPEILLTGFSINNKEAAVGLQSELKVPVNQTREITLPYNRNNLTIRFSALNFINPEKNVYAYKMAGLKNNDEWTIINNHKEAGFTNLEPGSYVFSVKASNNDGVWNETGRSLKIIILPPLWATWWAYCIYVIVSVTLIYKVMQFFRLRAQLERDLYNEHLQNERQEEFYTMKLDFFTNISHEIRTPLTLILGPVENLYQSTKENIAVNRQVAQIKNNAERLLRLITELMDFRKAETGNMVLYIQRNNVIPFIREIFLSFSALAEEKAIDYTFATDTDKLDINIDRDQLEKVFFNLLSNAFKFTPNNGRIGVDINTLDEEYLTVNITDNGKGIPQEYQAKLFTNYYQVHQGKANPGTGVGLALSKSIIELHHGAIAVQSEPAKDGHEGNTIFMVKLPYDISASQNVHLIDDEFDLESVRYFNLQSEIDVLNIDAPAVGQKKYSILLAEDNKELRDFIVDSLPDYQVTAFENGSLAFDHAIQEIPDLIISDIMMPVMNGLELCKQIKADERTNHIPVVLLTALATHIHQINGFQTGADAYLTKPFSIKLLQLNIHNLLLAREVIRKKFGEQVTLQLQNRDIVIKRPDDQFLEKLVRIIEKNMENPEFGVADLSLEIGMSRSVLFKKVCAITDLSPADFIKHIRLTKAADLLRQQVLTVNEITSLVGFSDRKYFSKEFKKLHGKTPTEMLAREGKGQE